MCLVGAGAWRKSVDLSGPQAPRLQSEGSDLVTPKTFSRSIILLCRPREHFITLNDVSFIKLLFALLLYFIIFIQYSISIFDTLTMFPYEWKRQV